MTAFRRFAPVRLASERLLSDSLAPDSLHPDRSRPCRSAPERSQKGHCFVADSFSRSSCLNACAGCGAANNSTRIAQRARMSAIPFKPRSIISPGRICRA